MNTLPSHLSSNIMKVMLLFFLLTLSSCATKKSVTTYELPAGQSAQIASNYTTLQALPEQKSEETVIAPGVVFRIESGIDAALNKTIEVPEDGDVALPYERKLRIQSMSQEALQQELTRMYGALYRNGPAIRIKVLEPTRYVYIGGLVEKPGYYKIRNTGSFQELFAEAGGLQNEPNTGRSPRYAIVQNNTGNAIGSVDLQSFFRGSVDTSHFQWQGTEKVFVQMDPPRRSLTDTEAGTIQILGQVVSPGEYPVTGSADFFTYLAMAGGPTAEADLRAVEIIRQGTGVVSREQWSVDDNKQMPAVVAGDMLVIGARQPDTVVPTFTGILGAISAAIIAAVAL